MGMAGALSCSGKAINELGSVSRAGNAGAISGDAGARESAGAPSVNAGTAGGSPRAGSANDAGAAGSDEPDLHLECPTCELMVERSDIRGVATDERRVYWVEHGTTDSLGNYLDDGRLLARDLLGGPIDVLADGLPGPESVAVSNEYAYLFVTQVASAGLPNAVVRVPLSGGAAQVITELPNEDYAGYDVFAKGDGCEYFVWGAVLYRIAETATPTVESVLTPSKMLRVVSDDTSLYFGDNAFIGDAPAIWVLPFSGGEATKIGSAELHEPMLVSGEYLYGQAYSDLHGADQSYYLARMPRAGGAWKRVAKLSTEGASTYHLAIDGDRFFIDQLGTSQLLLQLSLSNATKRTVLARQGRGDLGPGIRWRTWAYSPEGLFLATASGLYRVAVPQP